MEVAVADTGVGIAAEDIHRIMEPLYSTKARGLGLGLAIARAILDKNRGSMRLTSEVGKGTTFTVRLAAVPASTDANMTTPPASILVVDDEVDTCRNLSDILTDLGYEVDIAHDGISALELVRKAYDVALLDLKMPGMDGLTLYREIKKLRAGTVAIVVTAYAGGDTKAEALAAGAWQVLAKPVDFPKLLGLVDEALGQPLVMVVDDDHDLCATLWDILRERGYRVCLAHDEDEAAERLKGRDFKVVLIDMKLPSGDGASVFRIVRQSNPQARTVVITGHRSEMDQLVKQVIDEGADAVCYKPFDVPSLLSTLQNLRCSASRQPCGKPGSADALPSPLVLVVEDDADTRTTCATFWNWTATASRPPAPVPRRSPGQLGRYHHHHPGLSIAGRQCRDAAAAAAPAGTQAAVIISTGVAGLSGAILALQQGAADYILKPLNADALRGSLARIAERQKLA